MKISPRPSESAAVWGFEGDVSALILLLSVTVLLSGWGRILCAANFRFPSQQIDTYCSVCPPCGRHLLSLLGTDPARPRTLGTGLHFSALMKTVVSVTDSAREITLEQFGKSLGSRYSGWPHL